MTTDEPAPRAAAAFLGERRDQLSPQRISAWIYGLIVSAAVVAASSWHGTIGTTAVSVAVTLLVYWLAESYSNLMGWRAFRGHRPGWAQARETLRVRWPLVSASYLPLSTLAVSALMGANVSQAAVAALVLTTCMLFGAGWGIGRASGVRGLALLGTALTSAVFGVAMVLLKTLLH
jgi:hypothetical protein